MRNAKHRNISVFGICTTNLLAACTATALLAQAGCSGDTDRSSSDGGTSAEDVRREASEAVGAAGSFARSTVDNYKQDMRESISDLNDDIADLVARSESLAGDAQDEAKQLIASLRDRRDALSTRLDEARADSASAWEDTKGGLDRAWRDLDQARRDALERFDD